MQQSQQHSEYSDYPLFVDIECDGLKEDVTKIWCISWQDKDDIYHYGPDKIDLAINHLHDHWLVFHNGINYDLPILKTFYPWFKPSKIDDTFILSCLFEPDRMGHGLADWGEQFGVPKPKHEDWSKYSEEMKYRNIEDVRITKLCYDHLMKERNSWDWEPAIRLEYRIAELHARQEANGVAFDLQAANKLADQIEEELAEIDRRILLEVPKKISKVGTTIDKPFKLDGEYNNRVIKWINESYPGLLTESNI